MNSLEKIINEAFDNRASLDLPNADADIKKCFYQCGMPATWSDYFCLAEVPRYFLVSLGVTTLIGGEPLPSEGTFFVALTVLPWGGAGPSL